MKQLDLVVPGLCGPLPDMEGLQHSSLMDALAKWLSRADRSSRSSNGYYPELAALFAMDETQAMPSAVLSLLGHGRSPGDSRWLHADPVHLQADMDHAILRDSHSMELSLDEAEALVQELNEYLRQDGVYLVAADRNNWFLNIRQREVTTTPLHDVIGRNVNFFLPRGKDEMFFKSLMNEAQMLLHMSRVNQEREHKGLLPVNSLWLWGEGDLPSRSQPAYQHVYGNHVLIRGLAEIHGLGFHSANGADAMQAVLNAPDTSLVVLDELFNVSCYGDVRAWQQSLENFFVEQFEPLVSFAMKHKISVNLYPCNGTLYRLSPSNRYRLFRRCRIKDHIAIHE